MSFSTPLIHWDFESANISGTTVTNLGSGGATYNGTMVNTPTQTTDPLGRGALNFVRASQQHVVAANNWPYVSSALFTVAFYYQIASPVNGTSYGVFDSDGPDFWGVPANSATTQTLNFGTSTETQTATTLNQSLGWLSVMIAWDNVASGKKTFVNGSQVSAVTQTSLSVSGSNFLYVGRTRGSTRYFNGKIADFRLWDGEALVVADAAAYHTAMTVASTKRRAIQGPSMTGLCVERNKALRAAGLSMGLPIIGRNGR